MVIIYSIINDKKVQLKLFIKFLIFSCSIIFIVIYFNIDYRIIECKPNPGINCLLNKF